MLEGSVLEANFVRLLHCTETLSASDDLKCSDFPSYCRKLQELYGSLAKSSLRPAAEYLHIYKSRVSYTSYTWILIEVQPTIDHLSGFTKRCSETDSHEEVERRSDFEEDMHKWLRYDPQTTRWSLQNRKSVFFTLGASDSVKWLDESDEPTTNQQCFDKGITSCQIRQHAKPKSASARFLVDISNPHCRLRNLDDREARLNLDVEGDAERKIKGKTSGLLDVEVLERDKIAEDMLYLTEELRSTQVALGDRIRADIDILSASSTVAQANIESLASVSRRVREELGHKFGLCIWVLFLLSVIVFFWMVLFIKFTPKG
ncbi:Vesicle transport protein USE1 [Taenia solium]|eukprot:TsM_000393800 transcript=TsM_000393800 gene=TsM_000393800